MGKKRSRGIEIPPGKSVVLFNEDGSTRAPDLSGNRTSRRRATKTHDKEVQAFLRKQQEDEQKVRND